jgi:hypothetical protein
MSDRPLGDEHRELTEALRIVLDAANAVGEVSARTLRRRVSRAYNVLTASVVPHVLADDVLEVRASDDLVVTNAITREHLEIGRLLDDLDALRMGLAEPPLTRNQVRAFRRVLYGLHALLRAHLGDEGTCACRLEPGFGSTSPVQLQPPTAG